MQREREAPPVPSSVLGIRPWVFVLLFSILVLLFLPPFLSYSLRGLRPIAVRSGWDTINILLVLFAILCGVLSRRSGGDDAERLARPAAHEEWLGFVNHRAQGSYSHPAGASPAAGVARSRSGGYYSGEAALVSGRDAAAGFPRATPPQEWLGFDDHRAQGSYSHPAEGSPAEGVVRSRSSDYYPVASTSAATLDSRGDDVGRLPRPAPHEEWLGFSNHQAQSSYSHPAEASPPAGVLRSRSSGYYSVESSDGVTLGAGSGGGTEEWRCYDDAQNYRRRSVFGGWEGERIRDLEAKTIAVDTYVLRRSHSPRSGSPSSSQPPATQGLLGTSEVEISEMKVVGDEIYEPEKPHLPSPPPPEQRQPRRRRKVEKFTEEMEVDKNEISKSEKPYPGSPSPPPPLRQRQARRKSTEKLPEIEVGQNEAMLETRKDHRSPPPAVALRHQRRGSVGDTPNWETEQDPNLGIEKPHSPLSESQPPPAVPPPLQQEGAEEKRSRQKRSGGGADISAAWALFFPKKKGSKTNKSSNNTPPNCEEPASSVPAPPGPPPPVSVIHQLPSHKKGVSTNRRIHSESTAASPPPPPPPPPPPALRSLNWHDKGKEKVLYEPPLPPSSSLLSQQEKPDLSKYSPRPPSPLLPPPPPRRTSHTHLPVSGAEMVVNRLVNKRGLEGEVRKIKEREIAAVTCPSPDVDNKADLFIARCHANWKLEKQNSMREKERRKHRKLQETELKRA